MVYKIPKIDFLSIKINEKSKNSEYVFLTFIVVGLIQVNTFLLLKLARTLVVPDIMYKKHAVASSESK